MKNLENILNYLTVILSLVAAILGYIGYLEQKIILSLTLAVLALVGIYNILNSNKMNDMLSFFKSRMEISETFPSEYKSDIENAKEIWIIGIHHNSLVTGYKNELKEMVQKGGHLRVMTASPDGNAIIMTSKRFNSETKPEQEKQRTLATLEVFKELQTISSQNVQIKTFDYLFEYSAVFINPNSYGKVYIQRYTFKTMGSDRKPKIVYTPAESDWYNLIYSEIVSFWGCGKSYI